MKYKSVSIFDDETKGMLRNLLAVEIKNTGHYDDEEISEHVDNGMDGKVSDLEEILTPKMQQVINQGYINIIRESLIDYHMNEWEQDVSLDSEIVNLNDKSKIPLAYTELGDNQEFTIQVTLDLEGNRLVSEVNGEHASDVEYLNYETLENVARDVQGYTFDNLITLEELDIDDLVLKQTKKENRLTNDGMEM